MTGDKPGGPARRAITLTGGALAILVMTFTPLASQAELKLAAVGGLDQPCAADGICNAAMCEADPDCPKRPDTSSTLLPRALVNTTCGGKLWVEATNSPIGAAAATVHHAYPNFNMAQSEEARVLGTTIAPAVNSMIPRFCSSTRPTAARMAGI